MSQANVDAVRRCIDGWNRGEVDAWLEPAHPDVEWFSAITGLVEGSAAPRRGHAEMREFWDEWHAVWDLRIDLVDYRDLGDTVVALGTMRTRGEASGVEVESPVAYVFEFEGGLSRTVRAYMAHAEALEAVGLAE